MLLAIDIGNSNVVCALMVGETVAAQWRVETRPAPGEFVSAEILATALRAQSAALKLEPGTIRRAILASVVPEASASVRAFLGDLNIPCCEVGQTDCDPGIEIRVDAPEEVGADRIVNAVAAFDLVGDQSIVVDFGTATTFDVVARDGAYLGGLICPGIRLSLKALDDATSKLPRVEFDEPPKGKRMTGKNTVDAIQSGIYWGYVSMVEGLLRRLQQEHGPCRVIATGGLAGAISHNCPDIHHVDDSLTIQGLRLIAERQGD